MTDQKDPAVLLYELSEHPAFPALFDLLNRIDMKYYAPLPRKDEDITAYATSNWVSNTIREIVQGLHDEISIGRRLATEEIPGGEADANSRNTERRRI
jgi:hypothetical protein